VNALHLNTSSPQIVGVNAHYDHHRAEPGNITPLLDSKETGTANAQVGRLIFSIGCHSGYPVPELPLHRSFLVRLA
jgi:hypothetical protein